MNSGDISVPVFPAIYGLPMARQERPVARSDYRRSRMSSRKMLAGI
jgi:hypothetical protein